MKIEKVSCFPNEGDPQVIEGDPVLGDLVRITTDSGAVIYQRFSPPPEEVIPQPNTPGNPYFGKKALEVHQFYALVGAVLTSARYKRLRNDAAFLWVQDMLQSPTFRVVDPDDKPGQFLQLAGVPGVDGYLTATKAEDGEPLMTHDERDGIMAAWE